MLFEDHGPITAQIGDRTESDGPGDGSEVSPLAFSRSAAADRTKGVWYACHTGSPSSAPSG
ncbi:hypothetical protein GCM10023317_73660 [Actinopolymorpha pittospori]|uniref:Uncharacterized protein n=1 Tax=Actinopolymorpha pittospori TaxID=648752 RepID=A0A927RG15_9ACTN|nr:hypothetical protein [Actinopolymorpha pittospori]